MRYKMFLEEKLFLQVQKKKKKKKKQQIVNIKYFYWNTFSGLERKKTAEVNCLLKYS